MPKTIRNEFDKKLSYENLMEAHLLSRKGKGYRKEIILFKILTAINEGQASMVSAYCSNYR